MPAAVSPVAADEILSRYAYERALMGTTFRLVLFAPDEEAAATAAEAAFARVAELNAIMSDYDAQSELSRLPEAAAGGKAVRVSEDLWKVLQAAQEASSRSDGAFDVTVGPLMRLWRVARRNGRLPEPATLQEARKRTGYGKLVLGDDEVDRRVRLTVPGMLLDLGGIAKGYAVDAALEVLRGTGIRNALVDGGGDLRVSGHTTDEAGKFRAPWMVQVRGLAEEEAARPLEPGRALATSGDLVKGLVLEGREFSHIMNPRTGLGLEIRRSVTVEAPDCMTADALASALSVLSVEKSRELLRRHYPDVTASIQTRRENGDVETVIFDRHSRRNGS